MAHSRENYTGCSEMEINIDWENIFVYLTHFKKENWLQNRTHELRRADTMFVLCSGYVLLKKVVVFFGHL